MFNRLISIIVQFATLDSYYYDNGRIVAREEDR